MNSVPDEENKLLSLVSMGYSTDEASLAIERYGEYYVAVWILNLFCFLNRYSHLRFRV